MAKKVVIIGGVAAGMKTASRLRRRDKDAEITVVERGQQVSYGACGFPYYIGGDVKDFSSFTHTPQGFARDAEFFKNVKGFDVVTGHEAQKIDRANKTVTVMDKETGAIQEMSYDVLVLGTGATPVKLSLPGAELGGIHNFWFPWETLKVKEEMEAYKVTDVVIVGAGLIGMELAEAFHKQGLTVNIVEMQDRILPQMLDLEMADLVKKPLEKAGIRLYLEEKTLGFEGENGRVTAVKTDKRTIPAQLVIVAVGVRPNTELASAAGLELGTSGAIAVNEYLQTSDPDIYAGGDCAENMNLISKKRIFAPMGSTANKHGRVIADNICGDMIKYPGERTAEDIKIKIGTTYPMIEDETLEVRGRNLVTGLPKTVTVTSTETEEALRETTGQIVEAVISVLERTPPELSADILDRGIMLTGGGSMLRGMEELIEEKTGINTMTADDPMKVVAIGTGEYVEFMGDRKGI